MAAYIPLAILAAFSFALANLVTKFTSNHRVRDSWVLLLYSYLTGLPFVLLLPFLTPITFPPASVWVFILLFGLLHVIGKAFFAKAIYRLDTSTFSPFFQFQSAFLALLAFIFLGEQLSAVQYVFIALMFIGAVTVSLDERMQIKIFLSWATLLIIVHQLFHAVANLFAGMALKSIDAFSFVFWSALVTSLVVLPLILILGSKAKVDSRQLKPLFVASLFSFVAVIALFAAYRTNVTVSSSLALLTAPIVLILTFFASIFRPQLLEHHKPYVYVLRAVGVIIIVFSALQLAK